ncbi:methyltransferase domain-containing protein [Microlunatus sp. GCM10028923]|uniref:methyltransferase domain-containing protein n=1 Tax=Microlunatus sp. GCM10028923 TaxID=3273400 RepID=UPI00361405FD
MPALVVSEDGLDWPRYLAQFHAARPGVIEAVLSRSLAGDHTPYRWLARAVSDAGTVLDLACGSGPMSRELLSRPPSSSKVRTVIGVDLSADELRLAADRGPGPWVRGDALRLPFREGSVDAVTSSMGLLVVRPLDQVLAEVTRVLKPGGVLAAIAPALRPLSPAEMRVPARINARLRGSPRFPGSVELAGFSRTLRAAGLRRVEDARERYHYTVTSREDAELLLSALYLPSTKAARIASAVDFLTHRLAKRGPFPITIPMRRVVAIK